VRYRDEPEWRFDEESFRKAHSSERSRKIRSNLNFLQIKRRRAQYNAKIRNAKTDS
jgi:hypothetical protein